jgi:dTDP-4-dehydrorhamnose 3,5-epimerase
MDGIETTIEGVWLTPLKQINTDKGAIFHAMKKIDETFHGFGEAYFSFVNHKDIKAWKIHTEMVLNLVVPIGSVKFVLKDERDQSSTFGETYETVINPENNYCRLTIPPNVTFGFQGIGTGVNLVLNMASIVHRPEEVINKEIDSIKYNWEHGN